jgi:hypothetical protein
MPDFETLRAELARVDARLKALEDAMEPDYSKAIQEGDEPRMRELERLHRMREQGEHAHLRRERGRICFALDKLRPGWDNAD